MIPRYDSKEISSLWSDSSRFHLFFEVELALIESYEHFGIMPKGTAQTIRSQVVLDPDRIFEIEETTRHDIIAFCSSVTEQLPQNLSRFFHFGVTSSDIIDTTLTLQIKRSLEAIEECFSTFLKVLREKAMETKDLLSMGRSHGMYAEPLSFGQKLLGFYSEFQRRFEEFKNYKNKECVAQFSGAVGNYTIISSQIEEKAASLLGLSVEPLSTQVIPRDRLAKLVSIGALLASGIERFCTELRHLHRSEIGEVEEGFRLGQKGSSIMPHKKNPIACENLTGIARLLRSHLSVALENCVLWHERDISHSSAERLYLPDHLGLVYYALKRMTQMLCDLVIKKEAIEERVLGETAYLSSYYLHLLLEKTTLSREELYPLVQEASFHLKEDSMSFMKLLERFGIEDRPFSKQRLKEIYLKEVDTLFQRVLKEELK